MDLQIFFILVIVLFVSMVFRSILTVKGSLSAEDQLAWSTGNMLIGGLFLLIASIAEGSVTTLIAVSALAIAVFYMISVVSYYRFGRD